MDISRARPFEIHVGDDVLSDLRVRLAATRLPPVQGPAGWDAGADPAYLQSLVDYWRDSFDWRSQESQLNELAQFRAEVNGAEIHFIHERGRGPQPLPLILTHGFPDSITRFTGIIPALTDPAAHGGDPADSFDVIVPSLPWCGFSRLLHEHDGTMFSVHHTWHELMSDVLGYERYGAHGGDWGSTITEQIARSHAKSVIGIHLTDVPFWHSLRAPTDPSPAERAYLDHIAQFQAEQGAYSMIQGSRPQTLADGLADSPIGLAAWLIEKFQRWSDCGDDFDASFSKDQMLVNTMLYWATDSIAGAFTPYYDVLNAGAPRWIAEAIKQKLGSDDVPAAFALFPKDLSNPPREWAERFFNVRRWTQFEKGGHFAAMEQPEALVEDLREFFRPLRRNS
jgi:pimeloyl-ACP methyl ester carboxylesterase